MLPESAKAVRRMERKVRERELECKGGDGECPYGCKCGCEEGLYVCRCYPNLPEFRE